MALSNIKNKIRELGIKHGVIFLYIAAFCLVGLGWLRFWQSPISKWTVVVAAYRPYAPFFLGDPRYIHAVGFVGLICLCADVAIAYMLWRQGKKSHQTFASEQFLLAGGAFGMGALIFIYFAGIIAIQ